MRNAKIQPSDLQAKAGTLEVLRMQETRFQDITIKINGVHNFSVLGRRFGRIQNKNKRIKSS